jgi:hypothetical protein
MLSYEVVTSDNRRALKIVLLSARPCIIGEGPLNIAIPLIQQSSPNLKRLHGHSRPNLTQLDRVISIQNSRSAIVGTEATQQQLSTCRRDDPKPATEGRTLDCLPSLYKNMMADLFRDQISNSAHGESPKHCLDYAVLKKGQQLST